ncbi:response regulator transcription factor, partial [uncultured Ruminococcus sp.]|uniref:response regulator transcription factor n=1 Tax=uncultured Ruminococcus sp. TaxID=165186 RepID=UPI0025DB599B
MSKILVIEDDKEINRLICEYLTENGYEMLSASNGLAGLNVLEQTPDIDLCLLDLMLPMKSGDRVMQSLREFSDVPVIVLSAKETVQTKIDLFRLGVDDYITKPFDLDEL